jgi:hypothetical protein
MSHKSPYVWLNETPEIIAEMLEAAGWPRCAPRQPRLAEWRKALAELKNELARAEEFQKHRPGAAAALVHASAIKRLRMVELECRLAELWIKEDSVPPYPPHGSIDEAKKQLISASFDGAITARGTCGPLTLPFGIRFAPGSRIRLELPGIELPAVTITEQEIPPTAFHAWSEINWKCNVIGAVGGRIYNNVRYLRKDIKRLWPPSGASGQRQQPDAAVLEWMLQYANKAQARGQKVNRDAAILDCIRSTGARWRQALSAYQQLPETQRYKRGQH